MRRGLLLCAGSLLIGAVAVPALAGVIGPGRPKGGRPPIKPVKIPPTVPYKGDPSATAAQPIRLTVTPRTALSGRTTRFRFRVTTTFGGPFRNAVIRFGGKRAVSNLYGEATIRVRLRSAKRYPATAAQAGTTRTATARVRVAKPRRHRTPMGRSG